MKTNIGPNGETPNTTLSSKQLDAARIVALSPGRSRQEIANSLGISRRTLQRWLSDPVFTDTMDKIRQSSRTLLSVEELLKSLTSTEKDELLHALTENHSQSVHPEIVKLEGKIHEIAETDETLDKDEVKSALDEVGRMIGRIKSKILSNRRYNTDGTLRETDVFDDLFSFLELIRIYSDYSDLNDTAVDDAVSKIMHVLSECRPSYPVYIK